MSNYHEMRDVKAMIAKTLMNMEDWKVYGYKEDQSDGMTDYYSPADWNGIAQKNGYTLCIDQYRASERKEIQQLVHKDFQQNTGIKNLIEKLQAVTVVRGATESEEATAIEKINLLENKLAEQQAEAHKYIVTGYIPAHQANPPKCNWHIEKDGVIIAKGNGLLKFDSIRFEYEKDYSDYIADPAKYEERQISTLFASGRYDNMETVKEVARERMEDIEEKIQVINKFKQFITKLDTTCGCLVGEVEQYETVTVAKYKKELKAVEVTGGEVQEGQCFILKSNFNYGCRKGLVYRIHAQEINGKTSYIAYKLNGKLTKECTGKASTSNIWCTFGKQFDKLIEQGVIAFVELEEVKTPYEVEKVIKKTIKAAEQPKTDTTTGADTKAAEVPKSENKLDYEVVESRHTKTDEPIWLVKIKSELSKEEFSEIRRKFGVLKGYYSRFTHSFIFGYDPSKEIRI